MYRLIPLKNQLFEDEVTYLEKKQANGWQLKKKGKLLYHFEKVAPQAVTYAIDLLPKELSEEERLIDGWQMIQSKNLFYKKTVKVYYMNMQESRMLSDDQKKMSFYHARASLFNFLIGLSVFPLLLSFVLSGTPLVIPYLFEINSIASVVLVIASIEGYIFSKGIKRQEGCTKTLLDYAHYFIQFSQVSDEQLQQLKPMMETIGYAKQIKKDFYRLEAPLPKQEVINEIMSASNLKEENIRITHIGELYGLRG